MRDQFQYGIFSSRQGQDPSLDEILETRKRKGVECLFEELSTNQLRALDCLCKQWIFANKDLTVAEANEGQIDALVSYHKIKRELDKRTMPTES